MIDCSYHRILCAFVILITFSVLTTLPLSAAQAEAFDMAKVTCEDIPDEEDAFLMASWFNGYIAAEKGKTTMSEEWIEKFLSTLEQSCEKYPSTRLLHIARNL